MEPDEEHLDFLEMTPTQLAKQRRWVRKHARPARAHPDFKSYLAGLTPPSSRVRETPSRAADTWAHRRAEAARDEASSKLLLFAGLGFLGAAVGWWAWRSWRAKPLPTTVRGGYLAGSDFLAA